MLKRKPHKTPIKYSCEICDFISSNKKDYVRHLDTDKHKMLTNANKDANYANKNANEKTHDSCICDCGKIFKHKSSLSRHRMKCSYINDDDVVTKVEKKDDEDDLNYKEMFMTMMKKHEELQNTLIDVIPKIGNNNNNVNNFNLQIFLNENCKDAMNIMDFVNSLQLQLKDIQNTGRIGYVEGISKIMIDNLNTMDIHKRPIHCSDIETETLYVKDNDTWDNTEAKDKLVSAVNQLEKESCKLASEVLNNSSEENQLCEDVTKMISNISNSTDNDKMKVIHNIAGEVILDNE